MNRSKISILVILRKNFQPRGGEERKWSKVRDGAVGWGRSIEKMSVDSIEKVLIPWSEVEPQGGNRILTVVGSESWAESQKDSKSPVRRMPASSWADGALDSLEELLCPLRLLLLLFIHSIVSDSATPWTTATRLLCPPFSLRVFSNSCPLSQWCYLTISSSATSFFCLHAWKQSNDFFPGDSDGKAYACNMGDPGSIPGLGRSSGEGNGNPCQYPCLENPMDRGDW